MRVQYAPHLSNTSAELRRNYANVDSMRNTAHAAYSIVDEQLLESKDSLPPPPSKTVPPIGYEPALCDPLPTASCNPARAAGVPLIYEPIYRSTAQVSVRPESTSASFSGIFSYTAILAYPCRRSSRVVNKNNPIRVPPSVCQQ